MDFIEWVRLVEIPVFLAIAGTLIRHMQADTALAAAHINQLHILESTLKDRIISDAKAIAAAALEAVQVRGERDLANYKLDAMERFASASSLTDMEVRLTRYIATLDGKLDTVLERR